MWERTLQDLVRGLRANKKDEAKFIAKAVDEIRREIKTDDMELKAGAVLKLTYLDMLGYDMSWASFHVVEVMSSPKVHLKSIGYLAAAQSFEQDTDVLMLTTNLLKKDLSSTPADITVTLDGLSHIVTPELARDISPELIAMLNHSRPNIRKRAILALYKTLVKYPEAINQARVRLEEKLEDPDPSVVAATVNVLCELARRTPKDYLSLAPQLFHLLTSSTNNWMLIKIIKLFGSLSPHEPRLVKKLQPPITELISTTPAISLLYECVHTCIIGGMLQGSTGDSLAKLCVSKLATFIQDADQNLKYIALLAMAKIVPTHPHLITEYQDTIFTSINDQDISIRMRALDLLSAMTNRGNLQSIVQQLLAHLVRDSSSLPTAVRSLAQNATPSGISSPLPSPSQSPAYRMTLSQRILTLCSRSTYENVNNFEWYLSVLVDLAHVANVNIGPEIRDQLVNVVGRVRGIRGYAVKLMHTLLSDESMISNASEESSCSEVLWAAAWICGEYCLELSEPQKLLHHLLRPEVNNLTPDIISVYIHSATKAFGLWASDLAKKWDDEDLSEVKQVVDQIITRMREFATSEHIEVQERAANVLELFIFISADINSYRPGPDITLLGPTPGPSSLASEMTLLEEPRFPKSLYLIHPLFSGYELNPVGINAQASVAVPEGLDLDSWIVPPPLEAVPYNVDDEKGGSGKKVRSKKGKGKDAVPATTNKKNKGKENGYHTTPIPVDSEETPEERVRREKRKAERLAQLRDDPYYIIDDRPKRLEEDVDSIPVVHLDDMPPIAPGVSIEGLSTLRATSQTFSSESFVLDKGGEMPEGAVSLPSQLNSQHVSPPVRIPSPAPANVVRLTSFPEYEVPEDSSVEPIKVVRPKKKPGKKKRTITDST